MNYTMVSAIVLIYKENDYTQKVKFRHSCLNKWNLREKIKNYMLKNNISKYRIVRTFYEDEFIDWEKKRLDNIRLNNKERSI